MLLSADDKKKDDLSDRLKELNRKSSGNGWGRR